MPMMFIGIMGGVHRIGVANFEPLGEEFDASIR